MKGFLFLRSSVEFILLLFSLNLLEVEAKEGKIKWDVSLKLVNFDLHQEEKIINAVNLLKKIVTSEEFKKRILNYEYNGKKQFHHNFGVTNEEVYQRILKGAEILNGDMGNQTMDVELELYQQATNIIGYTYPDTKRIWMNRKYFKKYAIEKIADNLMHEWMHKLGFEHSVTWSKERDHSIPYAVGHIIEEIATKMKRNEIY